MISFLERLNHEEVSRELATRKLRYFIEQAWPIVEPVTTFVPGWHLDAISEHLEAVTNGQIKQLLINMPPRHMKSLEVSVFWPAWVWTTQPAKRWMFSSYALTLSIRDSLKCRNIVQSPWYQHNWGKVFKINSDQNQKSRFENDKTGYRLATSVDSAATGEGGDVIVVDDPHNVQETYSDTVREATITWWDETMSTRLNDPKTGAKVVVMQRIHEQDLGGHLLEQGGWEHLCLPARYEEKKARIFISPGIPGKKVVETIGEAPPKPVTSIGWSDPRSHEGELLWPTRFGEEELSRLEAALGSYATAGQLQQRPAPEAGGIIQRNWWQFYSELPNNLEVMLASWDMTFKDTKGSDFVVCQIWGKKKANKYLIDELRRKMDFPHTIEAMLMMSKKWPKATLKLVEDKANGPAVISTLRSKISGLVAVEPQGSKLARLHAVAPVIESGNVFLPDPNKHPWVQAFIDELASFPSGAYDDRVDSCSQGLYRLGRHGAFLA